MQFALVYLGSTKAKSRKIIKSVLRRGPPAASCFYSATNGPLPLPCGINVQAIPGDTSTI
ncbi:hypothetical protein DESC_40005 [Desulfosarcina cetonica]|nr:hypothetical protein DESC_40005 [Desulfosarcina cetonica]